MRILYFFILSLIYQGVDSRSNPSIEVEDDMIQINTLDFNDIFGGQHKRMQDSVTTKA